MSSVSNVHNVATTGFGTGTNELYDAARPSYPAAALHRVRSAVSPASDKGYKILEPGSGTGIFTRLLLSPPSSEYPTFPIDTLVAIEPSEGMRNTWQSALHTKIPKEAVEGKDVRTVYGTFDDFSQSGVEPGTADLIVIAQAWHWCSDHEKALREIHKYLSPTGVFILIWNLESDTDKFHQSIRELYQPLDLGTPQYYKMLWRRMFDLPVYHQLFDKPVEEKDEWALGMTEDKLVNRLFSKSYLTEAHLKGEARVRFERQLRGITRQSDHVWVDEDAGVFLYKYNTDTVIMRKKAA